jgi:hypothetical protein
VYLAYDTVSYLVQILISCLTRSIQLAAEGECMNPGKTHEPGILTLHPSEVFTIAMTIPETPECTPYTPTGSDTSITESGISVCWRNYQITSPLNLAGFNGPVPASAYFQSIYRDEPPPSGATITEDLYTFSILLPTQITNLEPGHASCAPFYYQPLLNNGTMSTPTIWSAVWDPPIVLHGTDARQEPPSVTAKPTHALDSPAVPAPGIAFTSGWPAVTDFPRPVIDKKPTTDHAYVQGASQTAVAKTHKPTITASKFSELQDLAFSSTTLHAGGPPIVTEGETISYGADGKVRVGTSSPIHFSGAKPQQFAEFESGTKLSPVHSPDTKTEGFTPKLSEMASTISEDISDIVTALRLRTKKKKSGAARQDLDILSLFTIWWLVFLSYFLD